MTEHSKEQCITVIGIDLAKRSFHLCGMDAQGRRVFSKQVSRAKLAQELANRPPCLVAMEACGSAHYWARTFQASARCSVPASRAWPTSCVTSTRGSRIMTPKLPPSPARASRPSA